MVATGAGTRVDVTLKLPQLQNLCKRDPVGYKSDYDAQVRRLASELSIHALQPGSEPSPSLPELIQFAAAVSSSSYKGKESDHVANILVELLMGKQKSESSASTEAVLWEATSTVLPALNLHRELRKSCVSALILMRNKGVMDPLRLLKIFFTLLTAVVDKQLRELLYRHMVNDVRNINKKGKRDDAVNRSVQSFLHKVVAAKHATDSVAPKYATDMVCELYRRRVWTEERAVAIVATAVESPNQTVMCRAMRFFLNIEEKMAADEQQAQETEWQEKNCIDYHLHSRRTASRQRHVQRQLKNRKKAKQKREQQEDWMDADPNQDVGVEASRKLYPAIELLRDPQGLAEGIFKKLRATHFKYEVRLLMINFVTRLVGNHELLLLPLYPYLQKYMGGHQRDVTAILAYTVQACHENVPPEEVFGILKTIAHNFITERCTEEQMAVGINAARTICARVPSSLAVEESNLDDSIGTAVAMDIEAFARDLAAFGNHRDRSVSIAGKAWTNMVRDIHPALLRGKDRGAEGTALHRAGVKPLRYGEKKVAAGVEGADLLIEYEAKKSLADGDADGSDPEEENSGDYDGESAPTLVVLGEEDDSKRETKQNVSTLPREERDKLKQEASSTRIFTSKEFAKMRKLVERERRLQRDPREAARRKRLVAQQGTDFEELPEVESESDDDDEDDAVHVAGAVNPGDIMAEARRKRKSKAEKLAKIIAGREAFETKTREGGATNIEKKRKKNFLMSKFSRDARSKGRGKAGLNGKRGSKQKGHEAKKRRRRL